MGRYATSILFIAAGLFILWHNATYADRVLLIPGVDMLWKAAANDPQEQGKISAIIFMSLGGAGLLWAIWKTISTGNQRY